MNEALATATPIAALTSNGSDWIGFSIIQAVGALLTALVFAAAVWTAWHARSSAKSAERSADAAIKAVEIAATESELRTRPWVGITGAEYFEGQGEGLHLQIPNLGTLPAERFRYSAYATTIDEVPTAPGDVNIDIKNIDRPYVIFPEQIVGSLFHGEPNNVVLHENGTVEAWRLEDKIVLYVGISRYGLGEDDKFSTTFTVIVPFEGTQNNLTPLWANLVTS